MIATTKGRIGVVQIAGLIARRILCFVREGATVGAGERIGMIRFGSRVDVYLPEGAKAAGGRRPDRDRRRDHHRGPARGPIRSSPSGSVNGLMNNG